VGNIFVDLSVKFEDCEDCVINVYLNENSQICDSEGIKTSYNCIV